MLIIELFTLAGCGETEYKMEGKTLNFNEKYKDMYITYMYPSEFKLIEQND